jgi:hypothetical protein
MESFSAGLQSRHEAKPGPVWLSGRRCQNIEVSIGLSAHASRRQSFDEPEDQGAFLNLALFYDVFHAVVLH